LVDFRLRDRDAIVTREGIIFRVYGYAHPPNAFICDPEYAPSSLYQSTDPRAYRDKARRSFYKFYVDQGLQFVAQNYPQHMIWHEPLGQKLVGVHQENIKETRQPGRVLDTLLQRKHEDSLLEALGSLLDLLLERTNLSSTDFGVFGSLLHGFYHPDFSDLDFIIYGNDQLKHLTETLGILYQEGDSPLQNEFASLESVKDKRWRFVNYSLKEYLWHQKRKRIYGLYSHSQSGRKIKAEFEPVRSWNEIQNEYTPAGKILRKGWAKLLARVKDSSDGAFMPSVYQIEPVKTLKGEGVNDLRRIVSFVEEFRLQAERDELVIVEGNLEQVLMPKESFQQVTLTYGARYYEQTLKVAR